MLLAFVMLLGFSGCRNRNEEEILPGPTEEDELVIYHKNTELAPMLMSLTEEYSKATGKKVSAKLAGNDFLGEMKSQNGYPQHRARHSGISFRPKNRFPQVLRKLFCRWLWNIPR